MFDGMGLWLFYAGLLVVPCAVQTLLCFLVRKKLVKCIPVYLVVLCFGLSFMVFQGVFGSIPFWDIEIHGFVGLMLMTFVGMAAGGVALGWGIYGITLLLRRKSSLQKS